MSRIMVFDMENRLAGEFRANVNRGWAINNGGNTAVIIPIGEFVIPEWIQFGRFVMIEHPKLPAWAGVMDPPWTATIPPSMTLYDCAYALSLRIVETDKNFGGSSASILGRLIDNANSREELYIRAGNLYGGDPSRTEEFFRTSIWEQMVNIATRANLELTLRPVINTDRRLLIYVDAEQRAGVEEDLLLHDGEGGNMVISSATIDGELINRMMGLSDESKSSSRKKTEWLTDDESIIKYRMRDFYKVFNGISSQSQLDDITRTTLMQKGKLYLNMKVNILDHDNTFEHLRLGNSYHIRATRIVLPGGGKGWSGRARLTAMNYDEEKNIVTSTLMAEIK